MSPQNSITLEFDIRQDDLMAFWMQSEKVDPESATVRLAGQRQFRQFAILAPVLFLLIVAGAVAVLLGYISSRNIWLPGTVITGAFFSSLFILHLLRINFRPAELERRIEQMFKMDRGWYLIGPCRVTIGDSAIQVEMRHHDVHQRWSGIASILELEKHIVILRRDIQGFIIPRRVFASDLDVAAFVTDLRDRLRRFGPKATSLHDYLANNDAFCPQCKYNLRGSATGSCPECGGQITMEMISAGAG